jgi:UDP-glucuronate decarboxylase
MVRLMNSENFTGPVNIGNPEEFTILDLAKKIISMTGSTSIITKRPLPSDDPTQRKPDITLAREKLGWEPRVSVADGLQRTIDFFRKELPV